MLPRHADIIDLDVCILSSSKHNFSLPLNVDNINALACWVLASLFWKWLNDHVIMIRQIVLQYANRPIFEGDRVRVDLFAYFALYDFPLVLYRAVRMRLLPHLSAHPLLQAAHMNQSLSSFAFARIYQRVVCINHFIHQANSTRRYFLVFRKVNLVSMSCRTLISGTCPFYKMDIDLLRTCEFRVS